MQLAVKKGYVDVVRILLQHDKVDVNLVNQVCANADVDVELDLVLIEQ